MPPTAPIIGIRSRRIPGMTVKLYVFIFRLLVSLTCRGAGIWEGGYREPGIAWFPGRIKPGTKTDALAATCEYTDHIPGRRSMTVTVRRARFCVR